MQTDRKLTFKPVWKILCSNFRGKILLMHCPKSFVVQNICVDPGTFVGSVTLISVCFAVWWRQRISTTRTFLWNSLPRSVDSCARLGRGTSSSVSKNRRLFASKQVKETFLRSRQSLMTTDDSLVMAKLKRTNLVWSPAARFANCLKAAWALLLLVALRTKRTANF